MRNLTAKQKKLLKKWFSENYDGGYMFDLANSIDNKTYKMIEDINPTEIHYQNVNNFLSDLVN